MLLRVHGGESWQAESFGVLADSAKSDDVLKVKIGLLDQNPGSLSSLESRNPIEGKWGGGIRADSILDYSVRELAHAVMGASTIGNSNIRSALTGLPELGDHLVLADTMLVVGALTLNGWKKVMDCSQPHVVAALQDAGMSIDQFEALALAVYSLIDSTFSSRT